MPNGGVPLNMALKPAGASHVFYCRGPELRVFERGEWDEHGPDGTAVVSLTAAESGSLAWFISHWASPSNIRPGYNNPDVEAEFDF